MIQKSFQEIGAESYDCLYN